MYSLRPARPEDFGFLQMTHEKTLRSYVEEIWGWNSEQQESLLRERFEPSKLQIIQVDGDDVGVLQVEQDIDTVFLANLLILPEHQRNGLGTLIINDIIKKAAGIPVTLSVLKFNPAKQLYERLGFVVSEQDEVRYQMQRIPGSKIQDF